MKGLILVLIVFGLCNFGLETHCQPVPDQDDDDYVPEKNDSDDDDVPDQDDDDNDDYDDVLDQDDGVTEVPDQDDGVRETGITFGKSNPCIK